MKRAKWLTMLIAVLFSAFALSACGDDEEEKEEEVKEPVTETSKIAGTWTGTVYYDGEASDYDWTIVELGAAGSYKDYTDDGVLVGTGTYTYDGNTVTIPSGSLIADNWGRTYTVTVSGKTMTWKNSGMDSYHNAEYRFTKK